MNSYNQPCFRRPVLRRILTMHGESEGKRPGAGVQGEVARLNNGVTLNPSLLMSAAAKKRKKVPSEQRQHGRKTGVLPSSRSPPKPPVPRANIREEKTVPSGNG